MKKMNSKKYSKRYEPEYSNSWLITYSDMVTIILCFFIIFFIFTAEEASFLELIKESLTSEVEELNEKNEKLKEEKQTLAEEKDSLASLLLKNEGVEDSSPSFIDFLKEQDLLDSVYIMEGDGGVTIRFKDGVLFDSGDDLISGDGFEILNQIGEKIEDIPNLIVVEGFTDNVPIQTNKFPSNWELSVARAIGVAKFMIDDIGILEERISVSGFGEQNPIDTNSTPEGRANNRRIEITILD